MKTKNSTVECRTGLTATAFALALSLFSPAAVAAAPGVSGTNVITQANVRVTGKVIDSKGEPIIGATIREVGTKQAAVADIDGNFSITVKTGARLQVSSLGYTSKSLTAQSGNMTITLDEDATTLGEVVAIGYGSQRKQDLSTSITSVDLDKGMKSRPSTLQSMLQGAMPGVMVQSNSGDPLATPSISIRGRGSRGTDDNYNSGDGVLYVVDGVPGAPYNIEDVESITVLKDAASAAIYGASVGSGGVIVITTKQAKEGKIRVSVNVSHSFKNATNLPTSLTSEQYNKVWADAVNTYGGSLPSRANPEIFPYGAVTRTDWMDEIFRTGSLDHYALSLSGGSENIKSFASVSLDKDKGVLLNTYARKLGAKANIDFKINKYISLKEQVTYQYTNGQGDVNTGHEGVLANAIFYPRSATVYDYDKDGNALYDDYGNPLYHGTIPRWAAAEGISGYGDLLNPVALLQRLDQKRPAHQLYSTTTLEVKPITPLTVQSRFTAGFESNEFDEFRKRVTEPGKTTNENYHNITHSNTNSWLWETTANYTQEFGKHIISAMAGFTMQYEKYKDYGVYTQGYAREDRHSTTFDNATNWSTNKPTENIWEESMTSIFGRVGYSWNDRYFVTGSLRRDASSKLYKDNNAGTFPAASASWKISSEPFFEKYRNVVNLLKIRGSYGEIGNVALVPRYSWNVPMGNTDYAIIYGKNLDQEVYGIYTESIGVRNLKWEKTKQWDLGLDLGLFNDEITLTVDYYNKHTKGLIERMPVPSVAGISIEPYGNVGDVVNRGWEFSAAFHKQINKVKFGLYGNLSTVHNEVLDLGSRDYLAHNVTVNSLQPLRSAVGHPWYSYYVLKTNGIFQTQEEVNNYKWTDPNTGITKLIQPNARPGDFRYVDFNNDGQINSDDNQYMGSYMPKITFGFGGNVEWEGFDFSCQFQGTGKSTIFNAFKQMTLTGRQMGANMHSDILHAWDYDKTSGIPRLALIDDANGNYSNASDFFLENGSYLRMKELTLGYTLPQSVMGAIGLKGSTIRVYFNCENVFTITDYTGIDPEVGNFGLDGGTYPTARTFSFGLNLNF